VKLLPQSKTIQNNLSKNNNLFSFINKFLLFYKNKGAIVKIQYMAHASFLLTDEKGTKILMDPYEPGSYDGAIGYKGIDEVVGAITISHQHADHNYIAPAHKHLPVFNQPGKYEFKGIKIEGIKTFHDTSKGSERGENVVFILTIDEVRICHLGDLGHLLDRETLAALKQIHVLLIPVGGVFTIDSNQATQLTHDIHPNICIPMHYKTEKLHFDVATVDSFIAGKKNVKQVEQSEIILNADQLPQETEVWVLKPEKI